MLRASLLLLPLLACGASPGVGDDSGSTGDAADPPGDTLAERYPGDVGIGADPAVVWHEDFEHGDVDALASRYDDVKRAGLALDPDTPAASTGQQSVRMSAGGAAGSAADLYKLLPGDGYQQLFLRYYVKHEEAAPYHHSGAWLGGYNPPSRWPDPQAGSRPEGDDRISVAVEPSGAAPGGRRLDFYNYWMNMRSGAGTYYGNALVHKDDVLVRPDQWMCVEYMVRLNDSPSTAAGGELALWIDDDLVHHYTTEGPRGYWVQDKFCPEDADARACLDYAPPPEQRSQEVVDLTWRSSLDLRLNWLWVQNYISSGSGALRYDDLVLATTRVGCIR